MAYLVLEEMQKKNVMQYGVSGSVSIPPIHNISRNFGSDAVHFIRDKCENLKTDPNRSSLEDCDGKSSGPNQIPYNMERDLDRLCLEKAVERFLETGSREDAFDVYYCYCEIFHPFGSGYQSTGLLLKMLSEHETNASSLLMKHRDHYSHSVYVFIIGLSIYKRHKTFRDAYNTCYKLTDGPLAACHFLEYWGMTALFHDIGYPFEIAHQQMKAYVCALDKNNNDDYGFAPYISYKRMDDFSVSRLGDLNDLFARAIAERLGISYLNRTETERYRCEYELAKALKDRAVHDIPQENDYLYMDHAYFSGLLLAKKYLQAEKNITCYEDFSPAVLDSLCAIMLHNSLFKFTLRNILHTKQTLGLNDGQPLAYLLMLCDELQCWDRAKYGQNTRSSIYSYDFDIIFPSSDTMVLEYYYDDDYHEQIMQSKNYRAMLNTGYTNKSGACRLNRCKFLDDIDKIITLKDMIPNFESNTAEEDNSNALKIVLEPKKKRTGLYLSDSSYLNIYSFALSMNGRYADVSNPDEMKKIFEENLSLEYKLSNIAQAKGFASQLEKIHCFYTDRAVDYAPVLHFTADDLIAISKCEHQRWCSEKIEMGWQYGISHVGIKNGKNDNVMRERLRMHHDLIPFKDLSKEEAMKDSAPMERMLTLIKEYDGLTIYRM